jgi:Leucine-rich repeat (LRR) protein
VGVPEVLQLVFQHLTSDDSGASSTSRTSSSSRTTANQHLALSAACYLHRVSWSCQDVAYSVIQRVDLRRFARPPGSRLTPAKASALCRPWGQLGSIPGLTSLSVDATQAFHLLSPHHSSHYGSFVARLKRLEVDVTNIVCPVRSWGATIRAPPWPVLSSCTGLRQLRLWCRVLPVGRFDIEWMEQTLHGLAIERLELQGLDPYEWQAVWGDLELIYNGTRQGPHEYTYEPTPDYRMGWLYQLTGLKELLVEGSDHWDVWGLWAIQELLGLSSLSISISHHHYGRESYRWWPCMQPEPWPHRQRRHQELLALDWSVPASYSTLSALNHLSLSGGSKRLEPPADLGSLLPGLQELTLGAASEGQQGVFSLPAAMACLTKLSAAVNDPAALPQLQQYTSLRELTLQLPAHLELGCSINSISSLEVLCVTRQMGFWCKGWRGVQLGALAGLRSLSLQGGSGVGIAAALASAAGCSLLTQVQAVAMWTSVLPLQQSEVEQLFGVGQVGQLRDFHLTYDMFPCPAQLGVWLGQQMQLMRLCLDSMIVPEHGHPRAESLAACTGALEVLPDGLQELHLPGLSGGEVPGCLTRFMGLRKLSLGVFAAGVEQLPASLSQLQRLEWLDVSGTQVVMPQPVLGQLPLLRQVVLSSEADRDVVLRDAPHLRLQAQLCVAPARRQLSSDDSESMDDEDEDDDEEEP